MPMDTIPHDISHRRANLLARLAAERSNLLLQMEGLDGDTLTHQPIGDGWTATGLLAHAAYWEAFAADRLGKLAGDRLEEIQPLNGDDTVDARNAGMMATFTQLSFDEAVAISQKERRNFLLALGQVPDADLYRRVRPRPGWRTTPSRWANWPHQHDAGHAAELARWRRGMAPNDPVLRTIHRALLRPLMGLSRGEFLALAALVPPGARESQPLEGEWTLKQMVGHLVDYEALGVAALKAVAAGREPEYKTVIPDFDAFNNQRAMAWAAESWNEVWANFRATRSALLIIADTLPDEALARAFAAPWPSRTTACGYLLDMAEHEREHADSLRRALGLPALPRRLGRAA